MMPDLDFYIMGNLWLENLSKKSILRKYFKGNAIYKNDLLKAFKLSNIVLNFIRKQNMSSHNMRTLEVPASGAFLLTERTKEQAKLLFKEDELIECFDSIEELSYKIKFYLNNEKERERIIFNSNKRVANFKLEIMLTDLINYIETK